MIRGRLLSLVVTVAAAVGLLTALQGASSVTPAPLRFSAVQIAEAHHLGPWLPGDIATYPAQRRMLERGYGTYCFDATSAAYPGFRAQAAEVSAAMTAAVGVFAVEVPWGPDCDVRNTMPPDALFVDICSSGAAACVEYWTLPVTIYYRRALGYSDWKSAFCHEGATVISGHVAGLHEHYDDVLFRSLGRLWTCMDFGTGVWRVTPYDRDRIFNAFVPDAPSATSLVAPGNGFVYLTWSGLRKDGGLARANGIRENSNVTRVAFAYSPTPDPASAVWMGEVCGPEYGYCYEFNVAKGWAAFYERPGCYWLRMENAAFWWVPQASAPAYWTLAGCTKDAPVAASFPTDFANALCIATRESGLNPAARNVNTNGTLDRGLFQINSVHDAELGALGFTPDSMFDPWENARAAAHLQGRYSWRIWSTARLCGLA